MKMNQPVSVVILAAGNSSRMNYPKLLLPFDDNRTFIEKIIDAYIDARVNQVVLVVNGDVENKVRAVLSSRYQSHLIQLVVNPFPARGRFFSIQLGLKKIKDGLCFLQNIDNPFISGALLEEMIKSEMDSGYVVPACFNKGGHPVLLSGDIIKYLVLLEGFEHNLRYVLSSFTKVSMEWPDENILANINTRQEYRNYFMGSEVAV